jgi:hypothetical protein
VWVEKDHIVELLRRGMPEHATYEHLLADVDSRLLDLESGLVPEGEPREVRA